MDINCQKEDLLSGIQTVGRAISTKNTLPVLGGIYMTAANNMLLIRATDLDITIQCSVPADVVESGTLVIADGRRFIDIVRQLPETNIHISLINDYDININYGASSLNIHGFDGEQFPVLPSLENQIEGELAGEAFARMVKQTAIAASNEESRPILTGIMMDIEDNVLKMVATDSHRLALATGQWQGEATEKVIIPARTMQEVAKLASGEESIHMTISKNNICFKMGNITFISRIINGKFPDYRPIFPKEEDYRHEIFINKKVIQDSLSRANLLSRDTSNTVKLQLQDNQIIMTADSPEIGNIKEVIDAAVTGEDLMIGYNVKYILDALKVIEQENIKIRLTGPVTPGVIVPEDDTSYIYLLLPVRIS